MTGDIGLETVTKRLYESLFLVDSSEAAPDWDGINKAIEKILKKADAEIVSVRKWDERKLAYEVSGKSRGTYILVYFNGDPEKISLVERDLIFGLVMKNINIKKLLKSIFFNISLKLVYFIRKSML